MKERVVMQGTYPERIQIRNYEGRIIVEKTRWNGGRISTMVTVEIPRRGSYSLSANNDGKLGEWLAKRSAGETLCDLEDVIRFMKGDDWEKWYDATPAELCEIAIKTFRNNAELRLEEEDERS